MIMKLSTTIYLGVAAIPILATFVHTQTWRWQNNWHEISLGDLLQHHTAHLAWKHPKSCETAEEEDT